MSIVLKNNASDFLAAAIDSSQTTLTLTSGASFPTIAGAQYFYVTIESTEGTREIVRVNARVGNTLTVVRGQDGTSAASFAEGSRVESRINAASVEDYVEDYVTGYVPNYVDQNAELAQYNQEAVDAVTRTIQERLQDFVSVKDFGAVGDGVVDDTDAIQAALDAHKNVYFPEGTYLIDGNDPAGPFGRQGVKPQSGAFLHFDGATLEIIPNDNDGYNAIYVTGSDITIHGLTVIGDKDEHSGVTGEFGMGIETRNCDNIKIVNCTLTKGWGDGIYIGNNSSNVFIHNTVCDDNRRQGMSVIDVDGLFVSDCQFNNTSGTAPSAGVDFEPNQSDEQIKNVHFSNVSTKNNDGTGILFALNNLVDAEVDVNISNYMSLQDNVGIYAFKKPGGSSFGAVNFSNVYVQESDSGGVRIRDWLANTVKLNFNNVVVVDANTQDVGGISQGGLPFGFMFVDDSSTAGDWGGFSLNGFKAVRTGRVTPPAGQTADYDICLPINSISDGQDVADIQLSNIGVGTKRIYRLGRANLEKTSFDIDFSSYVGNRTGYPGGPPGTRTIGLSSSEYSNAFVDQTAVGKNVLITLNSPSGFTGAYPPVHVVNINGNNTYSITVATADSSDIHPSGANSLALGVGNRVTGARLKLQVIDEAWHIIEQEGTWS